MPSVHTILVLTAALLFLGSALAVGQTARLLSADYVNQRTVPWPWRWAVWTAAGVLMLRATTLLFPGQLIDVSRMSFVMPMEAAVVLAGSLWLLDMVMGQRSPPPWSVTLMRVVALMGRDKVLAEAAMRAPPAGLTDVAPDDDHHGRRWRLVMMAAAGGIVVLIVGFLLITGAEAAAG